MSPDTLRKLRKWLTLEEAASELSTAFSEDVDASYVLRLVLDERLQLSIYLLAKTTARCQKLDDDAPDAPWTCREIDGVWDVPMRGRGKSQIEHDYQWERARRFCCNFGPATSGWTVFDNDWTGSPIMPSDNPFKWRHFEPRLILLCGRWYLRSAVSDRDLEEMLRERGLCVDHTTIYRWVQRSAPEIDKRCRPFLRRTTDS